MVNFEPWVSKLSMTNQGKLLTKLNPRYFRVFQSLPWLVYVSKLSNIKMSFYLFIAIFRAKLSRVSRALMNVYF